jgi:hypothetical protein
MDEKSGSAALAALEALLLLLLKKSFSPLMRSAKRWKM